MPQAHPHPLLLRTESDSFGSVEVPASRLWGAQTQRSLHHFDISHEMQPRELIDALALVKHAAAAVSLALGLLPGDKAQAIAEAAREERTRAQQADIKQDNTGG